LSGHTLDNFFYLNSSYFRIPLPLLIQVPKILFDGVGLLGLGDVILPGILLALLFRLDAEKAKDQLREKGRHNVSLLEVLAVERAYFWPAQTAYVVGFILTLAALAILQIGQPALLYLVPSVLGTTLVLAYSRGELRAILKGGSDAHTVAKGDQVDDIESGAMELDQMVQVNVDSDNFELESDLANPVTKYDEVHNTAGELEEL
jgi:hypothetical protein